MSQVDQSIFDLEQRRCELVAKGDAASVAPLLVDDYLHVMGDGKFFDKAQYLNWITETPRKQERSNLKVRYYGDVAVLNGDIVNRLQYGDTVRVIEAYLTQILVKRDGGWRFAQWHITPKGDLATQLNATRPQ